MTFSKINFLKSEGTFGAHTLYNCDFGILFNISGYQTEIINNPWARGEQLTKKGIIFGTFPYFHSLQKRIDYYFTDEITKGDSPILVYYKTTPNITINTIANY